MRTCVKTFIFSATRPSSKAQPSTIVLLKHTPRRPLVGSQKLALCAKIRRIPRETVVRKPYSPSKTQCLMDTFSILSKLQRCPRPELNLPPCQNTWLCQIIFYICCEPRIYSSCHLITSILTQLSPTCHQLQPIPRSLKDTSPPTTARNISIPKEFKLAFYLFHINLKRYVKASLTAPWGIRMALTVPRG